MAMNGIALITGAASGIGAATARSFIAKGVRQLALVDVSARRLDKFAADLAEEYRASGVDVVPIQCNVADEDSVANMVTGTVQKFGRVDYAVNAAGLAHVSRFHEFQTKDWDKVTGINERGLFFCMREQLAQMVKQDFREGVTNPKRRQRGSIVNIASITGLVGIDTNAAYVASKHAVVGMAKAAAIEYASEGIRINNVAPGFVETRLMTAPEAADLLKDVTHPSKNPVRRLADPEEIADVIVFLSSEEASFVNGSTWTVDGGYTSL